MVQESKDGEQVNDAGELAEAPAGSEPYSEVKALSIKEVATQDSPNEIGNTVLDQAPPEERKKRKKRSRWDGDSTRIYRRRKSITFGFERALKMLKRDRRVARRAWGENGGWASVAHTTTRKRRKSQIIAGHMIAGSRDIYQGAPPETMLALLDTTEGGNSKEKPLKIGWHFIRLTANNDLLVGWTPTAEDLLADDWYTVKDAARKKTRNKERDKVARDFANNKNARNLELESRFSLSDEFAEKKRQQRARRLIEEVYDSEDEDDDEG